MKKTPLFFPTLVTSIAYAQTSGPQQIPAPAPERDYGMLVNSDVFSITQKKTTLKDNAEITNYDISVTPEKEEFSYKVNDKLTPRKRIFGKRREFKMHVGRNDGKISRISSVQYHDEGGEMVKIHQVKSTSLIPSGHVNSMTECNQDFHRNLFGVKIADSKFDCTTVNEAICKYIEEKKIASELAEKLNACGEVLKEFEDHQKQLKHLSKFDFKTDMSAMKKINGKLDEKESLYEKKIESIADIAHLYKGYSEVIQNCQLLKQENLFPPAQAPVEPPPQTEQTSSSQQGNEE